MEYYNNLIKSRKGFVEQLSNLIKNQFENQRELSDTQDYEKNFKELENNPDYIQRIFIDAPWGMGKTYFGESLKEYLKKNEDYKVEKINVWEIDYFSDPMKSLLGEFKDKGILEEGILSLGEELIKLNWKNISKKIIPFIFKTCSPIIKTVTGIESEKVMKAVEDLISEAETIKYPEMDEYEKYKKAVKNFKNELNKDNKKKVILIDELDRCRPDYAISLLEVIKHFFGVKNIIFIFLINKEQLKNTVLNLYLKEDKNEEYFEKFFDIEFQLPEIDYSEYIEIEYKKYYDRNFYDVNPTNNFSNKKELLFERNFLDILNFYNKSDPSWERQISLRSFIKSFKKFKILISSLSETEKENYPLILCLIIYFYCREFKVKTSYSQKEKTEIYITLFSEVFAFNYALKSIPAILRNEDLDNHNTISHFPEHNRTENVSLETEGIVFNNLYYCVHIRGEGRNKLLIPNSVINENHPSFIWKWCQNKYEFINNMN